MRSATAVTGPTSGPAKRKRSVAPRWNSGARVRLGEGGGAWGAVGGLSAACRGEHAPGARCASPGGCDACFPPARPCQHDPLAVHDPGPAVAPKTPNRPPLPARVNRSDAAAALQPHLGHLAALARQGEVHLWGFGGGDGVRG
jgi:hypothetical protein